jgi:hypothetical protein
MILMLQEQVNWLGIGFIRMLELIHWMPLGKYLCHISDRVSYHIYVAQGTTDADTIKSKVKGNLHGFWQGVKSGENIRGLEPNVVKQIWISEIGWYLSQHYFIY